MQPLMFCNNILCTYWKEDGCVLPLIHINMRGACEECHYAAIEEEILQQYRLPTVSTT